MAEERWCEPLVEAIERHAQGRRVKRVRVRVGVLHHVECEQFSQDFDEAAAGTVAEGAEIELLEVPVVGVCQECGCEFQTDDLSAVCPWCDGATVTSGGDELILESVELRPPSRHRMRLLGARIP